jgi:hypothetical protein
MSTERWQQIEELYHAALERAPAERSAFIAEACDGDEELSLEVESLLASHDGASQFIEEPAAEAAARLIADDQAQATVGQQIGDYEVVELIGWLHAIDYFGDSFLRTSPTPCPSLTRGSLTNTGRFSAFNSFRVGRLVTSASDFASDCANPSS